MTDIAHSASDGLRARAGRYLNRYVSTDSLYRLLYSLIDQAIASGTNFLIGVLIARFCEKAEYGYYALGLVVLGIVISTQDGIVMTPYMWDKPKITDPEETKHLTGSSFMLSALLGFASCGLIAGATLLPATWLPEGVAPILPMLAVVTPIILLKEFGRRISFTWLKPQIALVVDVAYSVLALSLVLVLGLTGRMNAFNAYLILGGAAALVALGWIIYYRSVMRYSVFYTVEHLRKNWEQARWLVLMIVCWGVGSNAYPWVLAYKWGVREAAAYSASAMLVMCIVPVLTALGNSQTARMTVQFHESGISGVRPSYLKMLAITVAFAIPVTLVSLFFGSDVMRLVFGTKYAGHGMLLSILGVFTLVWSMGTANQRALLATSRADIETKINILVVAFGVTGGFALAYRYGAEGAAVGLLIGSMISVTLQSCFLQKRFALFTG